MKYCEQKNSPVVSSTDNVLAVETDAAHEFLVALENAQTRTALNVPQSNRIVAATTDHKAIAILEAGDSTLVTAECAYEFARRRVPYFDSPVTTSRHYVLLVEVDDVNSRTVANEDTTKRYLRLRRHVPDGNRTVLKHSIKVYISI